MSKPAFNIYAVKERAEGKQSVWTRIGAAWPHKKGDGYNIELEALPLNFTGKLVMQAPKANETAGEG